MSGLRANLVLARTCRGRPLALPGGTTINVPSTRPRRFLRGSAVTATIVAAGVAGALIQQDLTQTAAAVGAPRAAAYGHSLHSPGLTARDEVSPRGERHTTYAAGAPRATAVGEAAHTAPEAEPAEPTTAPTPDSAARADSPATAAHTQPQHDAADRSRADEPARRPSSANVGTPGTSAAKVVVATKQTTGRPRADAAPKGKQKGKGKGHAKARGKSCVSAPAHANGQGKPSCPAPTARPGRGDKGAQGARPQPAPTTGFKPPLSLAADRPTDMPALDDVEVTDVELAQSVTAA